VKNGSTPLVIHVRYCRATFLFTVIQLPDISGAVSEERQGVIIAIEVTAGAKEAVFPAGYQEWRRSIGCRVTAPALEGRANKAVLKLVAGRLGIPVSSVSFAAGATASRKRVLVAGMHRQQVIDQLTMAE
jgi:hypothetical protein